MFRESLANGTIACQEDAGKTGHRQKRFERCRSPEQKRAAPKPELIITNALKDKCWSELEWTLAGGNNCAAVRPHLLILFGMRRLRKIYLRPTSGTGYQQSCH